MYFRYFSGLKLSSSALALLLMAAGLYFGACSKDKEEGTETVEETESVEVEVETPAEQKAAEAPAGETDEAGEQTRQGLPPEITEPCSGKNEGDPCSVIITGGAEIKGTCAMTSKNILGCKPTPKIGQTKPAPGPGSPVSNGNSEKPQPPGE